MSAELKAGPLAHLPSGAITVHFPWLVLAAIALTLTRAADVLASAFHVKATTAPSSIAVPVGLARSARRLRLHPSNGSLADAWTQLLDAT